MKRTKSGQLGSRAFTFEEQAWWQLSRYMKELENYYRKEADADGVVEDWEERMADYLWTWKGSKGLVVTVQDINRLEEIMGVPGNEGQESNNTTRTEEARPYGNRPNEGNPLGGRRLYRDPNSRVLGGVCSGLAYYLGTDASVVRLVTVLLVLFAGLSIWVYIIMWIVIPSARTAQERQRMIYGR